MKKKKWLIVGIPIAVTITIIIILFVIGRSPSPTNLVKSFESAIANGDARELRDLVEISEGITWSEDHATSIIEYLKDNRTDYEEQIVLLNAQASYHEDGLPNNAISQIYPDKSIFDIGAFYITEENASFGKNYVLRVRGYLLSVNAPEGTTVTFNGDQVDMDGEDSKELGFYGPGIYTIEGQKDYDYTTIAEETEVTLFDIENFEKIINLDLAGEMVTVQSYTLNTALYVNDENSNIIIEEETQFGPVKEGLALKGVAEFPWGKGESELITIGHDEGSVVYDLTPKPITAEETKEEIIEAINEFAKNRIDSLVEQDSDLLNNVSDNLKKDYTTWIANLNDRRYVIGKALGTRIDFSNVSYENGSGGADLIHIPVEFHDEFDEVFRFTNEDLKERFQERIVTLEYNNSNNNPWVITKIENDHNSSNDNYMTSNEVVKTTF